MSSLAGLVSEFCDDILNGVQIRWMNNHPGIPYVKEKLQVWEFPPAAVVCAEKENDPQVYARATACGIGPNSYGAAKSKILKDKLEEFGELGEETACGNHIGCCAEPHAANSLIMKTDHSIQLESIRFSIAYRPRTGKVLPYCDNCKHTFPQLQ